jgi:hypothetical protein
MGHSCPAMDSQCSEANRENQSLEFMRPVLVEWLSARPNYKCDQSDWREESPYPLPVTASGLHRQTFDQGIDSGWPTTRESVALQPTMRKAVITDRPLLAI